MKKMCNSRKYKLAIIIINYRTPQLVIDCLKSIQPEIDDNNFYVVIVDNKSDDNSVSVILDAIKKNAWGEWTKFVRSSVNGGFSSGNNIGIKAVQSEYYLLLNSDTLIRKGAIKQLLKTADEIENIGLITPRLEWPDSKSQVSCFNYRSPISEFISISNTGVITKLFSKYNVPIPATDEISYPSWSSFACVLIRKEVFDDVGLMDEGYFMYFEDAEFCHRASNAGWKIVNDPSAKVVHLRGGSSSVKKNTALNKRLPKYYYESRTRYFYQLYGWAGLTIANLLWTMGRVISKTRQTLGRRDKAVSQKQWLDIWTNWLNPLKNYTHPSSIKRK